MKAKTKQQQEAITATQALEILKEGNQGFLQNGFSQKDFQQEIEAGSTGQFPFATILSCIDSRVPPEIIFDQGIGDIFSIRVAGNVVNEDVLGSMEFACKLAGTKLLVVLGHTGCGAVKGACDHVELGNLTQLANKIGPAVNSVEEPKDEGLRNSGNIDFVNQVAEKNVHLTLDVIREQSKILRKMEENGEVVLVGAMYDIATGKVDFL